MKVISFLFSTKKTLFPKTGLLLKNKKNDQHTIATIDETKEEHVTGQKASEKARDVINDAVVNNIIWWWPSGRAFKNMFGITDSEVFDMFTTYGFKLADTVALEHEQVEEDTDTLRGYIQLHIQVSDEHYDKLVSLYGELELV